MSLTVTVVTVLHVIFGMNFLGAVFVLNVVLGPIVLALSPPTAIEFYSKFWPPMARFLHASIGGTAIFGILLYVAGSFNTVTGTAQILLDAGIALGLLAMIEGEALQIPAVNKLIRQTAQMGASAQQGFSPEQLKAINKVKVGGIIGILTISLAVILMVAAATY